MTRILILAGGPHEPDTSTSVPEHDFVIAADSGLHRASVLGLHADVAIGDFDSVSPDLLEEAEASRTQVLRYPATKDATDLELAMDHAIERTAAEIVILGGGGGRFDHMLGNVWLLASERYKAARVSCIDGRASITVIRHESALRGEPGNYVSLLPFAGDAHGVITHGLQYPLHGETLQLDTTRGMSNQILQTSATVSLEAGVLFAVQPDPSHP